MLTIRDLKMTLGGRVLFENASLQINAGDRVALVGPNGAGKSTLFSIVLGQKDPDTGVVERDIWTSVGFLPQEGEAHGDETVLDVATGRVEELPRLEKQLRELEAAGDVSSAAYFEAHAKHDALADHDVETKAKKMLRGLGYRDTDFERPARDMSGGWIMRARLAKLLVMEPDLLLLDEPTNHLDLLSLLWLQKYLKNYSGALLLISHDRQFMDEIVTEVHEINERKLIAYTGNYTDFLRQREERYEQQLAAHKNQQKEIQALQAFVDRFRSVTSKASQAMSKLKQIERLELIEKPTAPKKPFRFQIPQPPRGGQRAVVLKGIHMSYGVAPKSSPSLPSDGGEGRGEEASNQTKNSPHLDPLPTRASRGEEKERNAAASVKITPVKVYEGLDLTIERGERTVLVGPNGAGKSTLLKILAGVVEFQQGEREISPTAKIGYFSQHRAATLDPEKSVLDEVIASAPALDENEARAILGSFLFRKDDIFKKTAVLSGGEKTRLNLIKFLVDPPNLLLMDEPTTHLDIHTVESLTLALERYEGTLVFISHDVHFIRHLANKVLHVNAGTIKSYVGGYDYFLEKTGALDDERAALTAG